MSLNDNRYIVKSDLHTGLRFSHQWKHSINGLSLIWNLLFYQLNCVNNLTNPSPTKQDFNCIVE